MRRCEICGASYLGLDPKQGNEPSRRRDQRNRQPSDHGATLAIVAAAVITLGLCAWLM